jgi:hypothetical protein
MQGALSVAWNLVARLLSSDSQAAKGAKEKKSGGAGEIPAWGAWGVFTLTNQVVGLF